MTHDNVLRDIDNILKLLDSSNLRSGGFVETKRPDGQGIMWRCVDLSRDALPLLAIGFTGKKALEFKVRYIEAFNAMEVTLKAALARRARAPPRWRPCSVSPRPKPPPSVACSRRRASCPL